MSPKGEYLSVQREGRPVIAGGRHEEVAPTPGASGAALIGAPSFDAAAAAPAPARSSLRSRSIARLLEWAFVGCNTLRVVAYLPTLLAIHEMGDSSQHSLWTWCTWFSANLTMALWLAQRGAGRVDFAVAVNCGNALMCAGGIALIVWYRL
jgi:hypothetical protein